MIYSPDQVSITSSLSFGWCISDEGRLTLVRYESGLRKEYISQDGWTDALKLSGVNTSQRAELLDMGDTFLLSQVDL